MVDSRASPLTHSPSGSLLPGGLPGSDPDFGEDVIIPRPCHCLALCDGFAIFVTSPTELEF